ncbi:MAG: putative sugar nucleotidyl transferase [Planctomycetota bacterium]
MAILLIEDEITSQLAPITLTRPAFAITCGGTRLIDQVRRLDPRIYVAVRPHLQAVTPLDHPDASPWPGQIDEPCLCVNARLVPSPANLARLRNVQAEVSAPSAPVRQLAAGEALDPTQIGSGADENTDWELLHYPHDVIRHHLASMGPYVEATCGSDTFSEVADGVYAEAEVELASAVDFDTRRGPILIRRGSTVSSFSVLEGPLVIDEGATILPGTHLKRGTYVGPRCKVGGEIAASILEALVNKQHHGYLGHAYLGSWVNLGAGTCNSDLKNTYGQINLDYDGKPVATRMQFLGCIIGDYAKTAINTSIFTGKQIGVASMIYGTVTQSVGSFVNHARSLGSESVVDPEVAVAMQQRMFARRDVPHRPCDAELLRTVYQLTAAARQGLPVGPPKF